MKNRISRNVCALTSTITLSGLILAPTAGQTACLTPPGDLTGDGVTNIVDVQCQVQVILSDALGTPMPGCMSKPKMDADLNCDGNLAVVDLQLNIVIVLGMGMKWPKSIDANGDYCGDTCIAESDPSCDTHPGTLLYTNDFAADFGAGWTHGPLGVSITDGWQWTNQSGGNSPVLFPTNMVGTPNNGNQLGYEVSYLQTPIFNLTGGGAVVFDSWHSNENNNPYDSESLQVSYDGGMVWERLITPGNPAWNAQAQIVTLSAAVPPNKATTTTRFRFVYNTGDSCCGNDEFSGWYIGAFRVYSNSAACDVACGTEQGVCVDGQCSFQSPREPSTNLATKNTCNDPSVQNYLGGPYDPMGLCNALGDDAATCDQSFQTLPISGFQTASCFVDNGACQVCTTEAMLMGLCVNTCGVVVPVCENNPNRTIYVGGPSQNACHVFDGDPTNCALAYHSAGNGTIASCWFDADLGQCRGCAQNAGSGLCVNECAPPPPPQECANDPSRTIYAGGPGTLACHQFDSDPNGCNQAFHTAGQTGLFTSCYVLGTACVGCGPANEGIGLCENTCIGEGGECLFSDGGGGGGP